ncbi:MAG: cupin domain-containing protein [Chitinophaga sp.]|uniref:cupin domain-containing protein n=1 Tax=Chitinophaga sp. TaxID=1869181 RepID=UPI0025B871BC|nr:cupin domain-containing protein [Chitinophaga sp.]MBV8252295.1 cupin domain-containing protein [Chitinophaga sp.]
MKATYKWMLPLFMSAGLFFATTKVTLAQDPVKVAPNLYQKVLIDNDQVRVMKVAIEPGVTVPWHSHPNHVVYAESSGKVEITEKDKAPQVVDITAGDAMYSPAVTHMAKNIGATTIRLVIMEIKP